MLELFKNPVHCSYWHKKRVKNIDAILKNNKEKYYFQESQDKMFKNYVLASVHHTIELLDDLREYMSNFNKHAMNNGNKVLRLVISAKEFKISNEIYEQFENYIQDGEFNFSVYSEEVLSLLEESLIEENYFDNMEDDIELLKTKFLNNKKNDLIRYQSEIKDRLAKDIVLRNFYNAGVIEYSLQTDQYIVDALELLNASANYNAILSVK